MSEPDSPRIPRDNTFSRFLPPALWVLLLAGWGRLTYLTAPGKFLVAGVFFLGFLFLYYPYLSKAVQRHALPLSRIHLGTSLLLLLLALELLVRHFYPLPVPLTVLVVPALFLSFFVGRRAAMLLGVMFSLWNAFLWPPSLFPQVFWHRGLLVMVAVLALYPLSRARDVYRLAFALLGASLLGQGPFAQWVPLTTLLPSGYQVFLWGTAETMLVVALLFLLLPVLERWLHLTTDFSLLELLRLDHPLLVDLARKAPGTFEHSMAVAGLAESAARAIGANPLLARVGGMFHDIGKVHRPEYFIENQRGENPHDRLSPRLSVLILREHVTHGVELARKHNLPEAVVAIIRSHHGTSLIRPFFAKAREMGENPDPSEFSYPGPRPWTKEQAIVMLADSVEAACRSLSNPDPVQIESTVDRIIRWKMEEGQLDEADLSLREIHTIREAFLPQLLGQFHRRIVYPEDQDVRHRAHHHEKRAVTQRFE